MPKGKIFCEAWVKNATSTSYSYIIIGDKVTEWDTARFSHPKTAMSFLIEKPKPVYTQAMADKGELPSVGMECLYLDSITSNYIECTVMYVSEWAIVLRQTGNGYGKDVELAKHTSDVTIKPLAPPIELIDGKAYQFDYHDIKSIVGIYHNPDEDGFAIFRGRGGAFNKELVTNIQLLEVKL